jgi:hypothetical protein
MDPPRLPATNMARVVFQSGVEVDGVEGHERKKN